MVATLIDIILIITTMTILSVMILLIFLYSDRSPNYKILSTLLFIPVLILELPHMLLPDPTNLIDITVHISAGVAIFLFITNLKSINIQHRHYWAFLLSVLTILGVELFLSILEILTGHPNPIGIDSLEDILWHTFGSMVGLVIHYEYAHRSICDNLEELQEKCKLLKM